MLKYIKRQNADLIRKKLGEIKKDENIIFKVHNAGSLIIETNDIEELLKAIDGDSDIIKIICYSNEKYLGWIGCLPYEKEDIFYDHSDNDIFY